MILHLPIDIDRYQEVRRLRLPVAAVAVVFELYQELAYASRGGAEFGVVSEADSGHLARELGLDKADLARLVESGLLVRHEGGYRCPLFIAHNEHLRPGTLPIHMQGAEASRVARACKKLGAAEGTMSLLMDPALLRRPDGNPMEGTEVRRMEWLVKALDRIFRIERPMDRYTAGLVQDAYAVSAAWTDEQIQTVLKRFAIRRSHPAFGGLNTEKMLVDWTRIARLLMADK
jgi:hypothetical protein